MYQTTELTEEPTEKKTEESQDEKTEEPQDEKQEKLVCTPGCKAALGATVGAGVVGAAFSVPALMGFTASGIAAGSTAAGMQAGAGNVAAGSTFAFLQSVGASGTLFTGTWASTAGAAVGGVVAGYEECFKACSPFLITQAGDAAEG